MDIKLLALVIVIGIGFRWGWRMFDFIEKSLEPFGKLIERGIDHLVQKIVKKKEKMPAKIIDLEKQRPKHCKECSRFMDCFRKSNIYIGVTPEQVTTEMLDEAGEIPACSEFVKE